MKTTNDSNSYGQPAMGCYLDQANYNNDELSSEICAIAQGYGWQPDSEGQALLDKSTDELTSDESETLGYLSEEAIDWLNSQETRPFMYWANEGEANAFGLWANVDGAKEDCGFISHEEVSEETDPENADYPAADYRGEWLHVNDHGNCTLYVREDASNADGYLDHEVWAVV